MKARAKTKAIRGVNAALAEAQRRWGKHGAVRDDGKARASTPEARHAGHLEAVRLNAIPKEERAADWRDARDSAFLQSMRYRYTVGKVVMGLFFSVEGQGDTWADAFAAADRKRARDDEDTRRIVAARVKA